MKARTVGGGGGGGEGGQESDRSHTYYTTR